jgi:hypothetical protein
MSDPARAHVAHHRARVCVPYTHAHARVLCRRSARTWTRLSARRPRRAWWTTCTSRASHAARWRPLRCVYACLTRVCGSDTRVCAARGVRPPALAALLLRTGACGRTGLGSAHIPRRFLSQHRMTSQWTAQSNSLHARLFPTTTPFYHHVASPACVPFSCPGRVLQGEPGGVCRHGSAPAARHLGRHRHAHAVKPGCVQ